MTRRILLADDSLTIQKVVELTFADTDYEVVAVSSGDELLRRLPDSSADVIICDVIMPGRDGYDVCQEIKSNPDFLHLPVILLTGTFEPFDRDRALAAGCSEIVTKPFEAKKLVDAVERLATAARPGPGQFEDEPFTENRVTPPPPTAPPDTLDGIESSSDSATVEGFAGMEKIENVNEPDGIEKIADVEEIESLSDIEEIESFADLDDTDATPREAAAAPADEDEQDEALDFSTSGFLEMEVAGREKWKARYESPTDGIEFEPEVSDESSEDADPFGDQTGQTAGFAGPATPDPPPPLDTWSEIGAVGDDLGEPFEEPSPSGAEDEPFPTEFDEEPPASAEEPSWDAETQMTTPINVAAVTGVNDPTTEEAAPTEAAEPETDELDNADTQDLALEPKAEPVPEATVEEAGALALSDEDIDRIARRVVELSRHIIEHIAWEVIPDMAEIVVRERVREIEATAEGEHD